MGGSLKAFRDVSVIHHHDNPVFVPVGAGSPLEDTIYVYTLPFEVEFEVDGCRLCFVKEKQQQFRRKIALDE